LSHRNNSTVFSCVECLTLLTAAAAVSMRSREGEMLNIFCVLFPVAMWYDITC